MEFTFFLTYSDDSECNFEVKVEGEEHEYMALLMMIARGTLMASMANRITVYNDQGWDVLSYVK